MDDTTIMAESEKELKSLLTRVNEESEKATLASGPLASWQIEGEKGNSDRFYFLGFQSHCGQ